MRLFSLFPTAIGACGIAWFGDTVVATNLPEASAARTAARLAGRTGATAGAAPAAIGRAMAAMTALLDGDAIDLGFIACDLTGVDGFAGRVYAATRAIPPGETRTYGAIATQLGDRLLARKVGQALGRNPVPIIIPCHRVMGAGGRPTGFSANGGVATKLRMLAIEGARVGAAPGLFDNLPLAVRGSSG